MIVTLRHIYQRQYYGKCTLHIIVALGVITTSVGLGAMLRLVPMVLLLLCGALFGIALSAASYEVRKDKHSVRLVALSIGVLLLGMYMYLVDKDALSVPIHEWSVSSYVIASLLITMFAALFVI